MNNQFPIVYLIIRWCTKGLRINFLGLVLLAILFFLGCWLYGKWTTIPEKHFHYNLAKLYGCDRIENIDIDVYLDYSQVMDEDELYPSYTNVKVTYSDATSLKFPRFHGHAEYSECFGSAACDGWQYLFMKT